MAGWTQTIKYDDTGKPVPNPACPRSKVWVVYENGRACPEYLVRYYRGRRDPERTPFASVHEVSKDLAEGIPHTLIPFDIELDSDEEEERRLEAEIAALDLLVSDSEEDEEDLEEQERQLEAELAALDDEDSD